LSFFDSEADFDDDGVMIDPLEAVDFTCAGKKCDRAFNHHGCATLEKYLLRSCHYCGAEDCRGFITTCARLPPTFNRKDDQLECCSRCEHPRFCRFQSFNCDCWRPQEQLCVCLPDYTLPGYPVMRCATLNVVPGTTFSAWRDSPVPMN
jgi:hypothetical protein